MTTTVNIPEDILLRAMKRAGTESPEEAVAKAVEEYATRPTSQRDLIPLLGTSDTFMTPEELKEMREMD